MRSTCRSRLRSDSCGGTKLELWLALWSAGGREVWRWPTASSLRNSSRTRPSLASQWNTAVRWMQRRIQHSEIHVENKVEGQQSSFRYIIETLTLIYNLILLFVGSTREILHDTLFKIIVTLGLKKPPVSSRAVELRRPSAVTDSTQSR